MAEAAQQKFQDHYQPHLETIDSSQPLQLTTSSLRQLSRGDNESDHTLTPVSPIMSRRTSIESDRFSAVSGLTVYFPNNPANVRPAPIYVASFGASQVVSENLSSQRRSSSDDEDDGKLNKDDVRFNEPALGLVNAFLDQLLYSFLSTARSTSLSALRPAVAEVLKHRLGRDAISSAEEELAELLAGGEEDEEEDQKHKNAEQNRRWDLELVWKRTRLRVMVYMRLGEMEDEDEQRYVKEEELFHGNERRFSQSSGLVSWAAAIFLTSVLEYVAEQTLQVAGKASYTRARRQSRTARVISPEKPRSSVGLMVEEYDVEKVALNATLGRLWRTWRKALRNNNTPNTPTHRSSISRVSRENMVSAMSHQSSFGTAHESSAANESRPESRNQSKDIADIEYPEHILAANIPLPLGDNTKDVDEIMVAGLAKDPDNEEEAHTDNDKPYADELVGSLVSLPLNDEKRDLDEIMVAGLARDPDSEEQAHTDNSGSYAGDLVGSLVPLPLHDEKRDVDEIEVPGLAKDPDAADEIEDTVFANPARRKSLAEALPYRTTGDLPTPDSSHPNSPMVGDLPEMTRPRSMSVPTPARTPLPAEVGTDEEQAGQDERLVSAAIDGAEDDSPSQVRSQPEVAEEPRPSKTTKEKRKSEFPWIAGASAAAAGAGTWAVLSQKNEEEAQSTSKTTDPEPAEPRISSKDIESYQEVSAAEEENTTQAVPDAERTTSQQSFSAREIEELDRRKSLLDIKALMMVNGPSGQESPQTEEPSSLAVRAASHVENGEVSEGVSEEEGPEDAIGVARTSNVPSITPGVSGEQDGWEARGSANRPSRLILDDSRPGEVLDSPTIKRSASQRQYLDLTTQAEGTKPTVNAYNNAPVTNGLQPTSGAEAPSQQQTYIAEAESGGALHKKESSESQSGKMIVPRSSDAKSPKSPRLVSDPDALNALTSASIRGPEDFDSFIQGGDTVKYTLTPDSVRDEPNSATAQQSQNQRWQLPAGLAAESDNRASRSQSSRYATAASAAAGAEEEARYQSSKRRSISKPSPRNVSTHRKSGLMAREPRVMTESTRDFADFIRSTGPHENKAVYPLLANASQTSLHSLRNAHIQGASASREASRSSSPTGEHTRSFTKNPGDDPYVPPVPPVPARPKTNMQPRGAKAATIGSSDLIDFIRSGPDEDGMHRISRSVAPFRTTMDSDQLRDFTDRDSVERSMDSRLTTSTSMPSSQRTSYNSRSALLNGTSSAGQTVQPAYSAQPPRLSLGYGTNSRSTLAKENGPVRKRVRNKDPYAMDFLDDDDDDDLLTSLPRGGRQEESLADFLRNNEPPKDNAPVPIVDMNSPEAQRAAARMKASNGNSQQFVHTADGRSRSVNNGPRSKSGVSTPQAVPASRASTVTSPKMQARGGAKDISANSNTQALADFFKSGPADEPDSAPAPSVGRSSRTVVKDDKPKKKSGGFFSRSIKRKTYLDMP